MNRAIFLDRDGTINVDVEYVHNIEDLRFEEGAIEGLRLLQNLREYKLIIITGQSGIGRGYYTEDDYHRFMDEMYRQFRLNGIVIDGEYFCPHHPEKGKGIYRIDCECRKPKIGMLEQAAREFGIDLSKSWVIGDKTDDIEMGRIAGCRTVLVRTGKGGKDGNFSITPNYTADNLLDAARYIFENSQR
ncbi:D-glycero-beta-D-manno-heptose 1,7-bisphosphate 7-phosphatase [Candidatus Woesearchaeota archaeon]|nr:D-glycero-beta-D-manno-heptose 1,7-bisphosphate 7-phosphatase [Candidatus Woesearchaeota archaeon]